MSTLIGYCPHLIMRSENGPEDRGLIDWPEYSGKDKLAWIGGWGERSGPFFPTRTHYNSQIMYLSNMISVVDGGPWKSDSSASSSSLSDGPFPPSECRSNAFDSEKKNVGIAMDVVSKPINKYDPDTEWTKPRGFAVGIQHGKRNACVTLAYDRFLAYPLGAISPWLGFNLANSYDAKMFSQNVGEGDFKSGGGATSLPNYYDTSETSHVYLLFHQQTGEALYFEVYQFYPNHSDSSKWPFYPSLVSADANYPPMYIYITLKYRKSFDDEPQSLSEEFKAWHKTPSGNSYPIASAWVIDNVASFRFDHSIVFQQNGYEDPAKPGEPVYVQTYNNTLNQDNGTSYNSFHFDIPEGTLDTFDNEDNAKYIYSGLGVSEREQFPWRFGISPLDPSGPEQWNQRFNSTYANIIGNNIDPSPYALETNFYTQTIFVGAFQVNAFDNRPGEYIPREWIVWQPINTKVDNPASVDTTGIMIPTLEPYTPSIMPPEGFYPICQDIISYPEQLADWYKACQIIDRINIGSSKKIYLSYGMSSVPNSLLHFNIPGGTSFFGSNRYSTGYNGRDFTAWTIDSNEQRTVYDTWNPVQDGTRWRVQTRYGLSTNIITQTTIDNLPTWQNSGMTSTSRFPNNPIGQTLITATYPTPRQVLGSSRGVFEWEMTVWDTIFKNPWGKTTPDSAFTPAVQTPGWHKEWARWESACEVLYATDPKRWPVPPPPPPPPVTTIPPLHMFYRADGLRPGGAPWMRKGMSTRQNGLHMGPITPL